MYKYLEIYVYVYGYSAGSGGSNIAGEAQRDCSVSLPNSLSSELRNENLPSLFNGVGFIPVAVNLVICRVTAPSLSLFLFSFFSDYFRFTSFSYGKL